MYKIKYPIDPVKLVKFENEYYDSLSKSNEASIDTELNKLNCAKGIPLSFERLVKMTFEDLQAAETTIINHILTLPQVQKTNKSGNQYFTTEFEHQFDYGSNQGRIAKFFMSAKQLQMKTCYYCGISFINALDQLPNYRSKKDFINNAEPHELLFVNDLSKTDALQIINSRPYSSGSDPKLSLNHIEKLKKFNFSKNHNHFTLDHVIPQSSRKFLSLSLYNFVPSCYSCNSKFKKALKFLGPSSDLKFVSPTSSEYSFTKDYRFEVVFTKNFKHIQSIDDFHIQDKILRNFDHVGSYLRMFKLLGRYTFHKDIILDLVLKKVKYPDSKIRSLSKRTGVSQRELRRRIFGEELFIEPKKNEPFVKFKRDAAINIGIKGVLKS